ncbi:MAG: dihydroorotate dehydrogenase electron transfer subunit [Erysipelotrichaceae bacterium]|nr:dihydroorotate dehydrogenase electron transfer subunit [Erysipelotrichaceae bacterium]
MKQGRFKILENEQIALHTFRLRLQGEGLEEVRPGQFVNVKLEPFFLRRPISVCDVNENVLTLIYKTVGEGTKKMSKLKEGELDLLTGLGNGYDLNKSGTRPLLIGGGVGVPPLYLLAKELRKQGKEVQVILGFNKKEEIFMEKEFEELGCKVYVTTADGSYGIKGFVSDAMDLDYSYFYSCGPLPMLKAVNKMAKSEGEFSFEERMGCGFGACMGCSIQVKDGYKRVCKEGPVFERKEILWQD